MRLKTITAIALLAFAFIFTSLLLFGFFGQGTDAQSKATFAAGYFALLVFVFGAIYIAFSDSLEGFLQHASVIVGLLVIAGFLAGVASNLKDDHIYRTKTGIEGQQLNSELKTIQMTIENETAAKESMQKQLMQILQDNNKLQDEVNRLELKSTQSKNNQELLQCQTQLVAQDDAWQKAWDEQQAAYEDALAAQKRAYERALAAASIQAPRELEEDDD